MDREEHEVSPERGFRPWLEEIQEKFASTFLGHFYFTQYIKLMDIFKVAAEYNPQENANEEKPVMGRRLPWLIFIPIIFTLRLIRLGLSLVAIVLRRPPVTRHDMVVWFRTELRRLRRIRRRGKTNIIMKAIERKLLPSDDEMNLFDIFLANIPLMRNLLALFCFKQTTFEEPEAEEIRAPKRKPENPRKRAASDSSTSGLDLNEKLDKYAEEESDELSEYDDASYDPDEEKKSDLSASLSNASDIVENDTSPGSKILNKTFDEVAFKSPQIVKKLYANKSSDQISTNGSSYGGTALNFEQKQSEATEVDQQPKNENENNLLSVEGKNNGIPDIVVIAPSPIKRTDDDSLPESQRSEAQKVNSCPNIGPNRRTKQRQHKPYN